MPLCDSLFDDIKRELEYDETRHTTTQLGYDVEIIDIPTFIESNGDKYFEQIPASKLVHVEPSANRICTAPGILKNARESTPIAKDLPPLPDCEEDDDENEKSKAKSKKKGYHEPQPERMPSSKVTFKAARKYLPSSARESDSSDSDDEIPATTVPQRKRRLSSSSGNGSNKASKRRKVSDSQSVSSKSDKRSDTSDTEASSQSSVPQPRIHGWTPINVHAAIKRSSVKSTSESSQAPSDTTQSDRPRTPLPNAPRKKAPLPKKSRAAKSSSADTKSANTKSANTKSADTKSSKPKSSKPNSAKSNSATPKPSSPPKSKPPPPLSAGELLARARLELHKQKSNCYRCLMYNWCQKHPNGSTWTQLPWPPSHEEAKKKAKVAPAPAQAPAQTPAKAPEVTAPGVMKPQATTSQTQTETPKIESPAPQASTPAIDTTQDSDPDVPKITQLPRRRAISRPTHNFQRISSSLFTPTTLLRAQQKWVLELGTGSRYLAAHAEYMRIVRRLKE